jgi:RNA polymerase sigma factor (sigma-70 family)
VAVVRERSRYFEPPRLSAVRPAPVVSLHTDDEIIAGLARGEGWAAEELYDRVHAHIERTLRRLLRFQTNELDDMMQATFERIIRFLSERTLLTGSNLPAWSSAVAANVALDFLRRRGSERRLFMQLGSNIETVRGQEAGPERHTEARISVARLQQLLARMRPKYAETLVLHDILGHDLSEIARLTGASVAATQSRLVRGRKELLRRTKKTESER